MPWVLIAEDNDDLRVHLVEALEEHGYTVRSAGNGGEVVQMLDTATEMPAVLLLDLLMPRVSGYEVLRAMRGLSRTKRVPVIILSAALVDEGELAGAEVEAVFTKPVAALPLFQAIDRAIKKNAGSG